MNMTSLHSASGMGWEEDTVEPLLKDSPN